MYMRIFEILRRYAPQNDIPIRLLFSV